MYQLVNALEPRAFHAENVLYLSQSMEFSCIVRRSLWTASRGKGILNSRPQRAHQRQDLRPYVGSRHQWHV